jgi:hypothetical protein
VATGTAPLAYQWQKNGANIAGATAASYTTPVTTTADSGSTFRVVVTNTAGTVTSSAATLTVNAAAVAPTITTQPVNQTVTAGQTAAFTVVATGTAPLAYQWQKNGANIAGATAASYTTPVTTTADSGSTFRVVVTNTAGTVTSSAATLTVNAAAVAPTITTQPVNQTVTAGQTAAFTVVAAGTAPLAYQWQKNSANITGATAASYTTPVTTTADSGSTFRVVVTNTAGTVTSSAATLTVNAVVDTTPPTVPTGLAATAVSSSQINLAWTASTDNVGVTGYKVFRGGTQVATSPSTSYQDTGLAASTAFTYTVAAFDAAGNTSAQSTSASATTLASSGGGIPSTLGWYQIPNTQLAPICPTYTEIQGNSGCAAVMSAWSGGLYDPQRARFIITGGGHNDYFGNEVYAIDFSSGTPTRVLVHDASHGSGFSVTDNETMPDGNPTPRHTYGCLTYFPTQDEYIYCGGGSNVNGNIENGMWRYNPKTNTWTNVTPSGGPNWATNGTTPKMAYDSVTDAAYALADAAPGTFFRWNPTTHTWTGLGTIGGAPCTGSPVGGGGTGKDSNVIVAPDYRFYVCAGNGELQAINLNTLAVQNDSTATGCSALANGPGPGLTYDSVQKLVVGYVGGNSVIEYNPSGSTVSGVNARSCSTVTYTGGPGAQQGNGTYGRFQYSPNLGVFVVTNSISQNAYSLRLSPASGGTSGPAISGVSVNSITTLGATIIWTTDVPATSQVEYGLTTAYGTLTTLNATLVSSHAVALSGLATNTLYHYRVRSKNSSGVESIGGDSVFQTNNTTDTTPPTVSVTAPAAGGTVSGSVTVSANASDNVAVASVQLLLDGASLGTAKMSAPYSMTWDTTTSSNGTHTLGAVATDTSGNVGNATSVTVNVSNASPSSNFQTLCTAPGVVKCVTWDNASDFTPASGGAGYASGLYPAEDGAYEGVQDTTSKVDGAGSLKFVIRAGSVHPHGTNPAGYWLQQFGTDNAATKYGEGTTLYLQFRFMVSPEMLNYDWTQAGGEGWKVFIVWGPIPGQSCTGDQFVQENTNQTNVATAYVSCGSPGLYTNNGNPPMNIEQGDYNCAYAGGGATYTGPNCFVYPSSTWMTEYWVVHIGTYGQPNTTFQAWIAPEGQPLKQFINLPNFTFGDPSDHTVGLQGIILQPYFSGANGSTTTPAASMWFDDLIISTQPIAAPTN